MSSSQEHKLVNNNPSTVAEKEHLLYLSSAESCMQEIETLVRDSGHILSNSSRREGNVPRNGERDTRIGDG